MRGGSAKASLVCPIVSAHDICVRATAAKRLKEILAALENLEKYEYGAPHCDFQGLAFQDSGEHNPEITWLANVYASAEL
ncbi:hypothetical protein Vi05172_g6335 [Venturia inaequalis]|nr:hypothetical protein Vi05172_g6335 [Venturia inaequalis]